jgi:hypothetical protein
MESNLHAWYASNQVIHSGLHDPIPRNAQRHAVLPPSKEREFVNRSTPFLIHASILEPQRPTVFLVQPCLSVREAACDAAVTLRVVWAVEEGDMLVSDISEPENCY